MNKFTVHDMFGRKVTMRILDLTRSSAIFRWMLLLAALIVPQVVQAAQWNATVGGQTNDKGHQALAFLPNEIWIHAGDRITWHFDADEIHTVTFLRADQPRPFFADGCPGFSTDPATFDGSTCVTTPPMVKGQTFTVIFSNAGNFKLTCLVHENMTGTIHVLSLSAPLPHDQAFYDHQAADQRHDLLSDSDRHEQHDHLGPLSVTAGIGEVSATAGGSNTLSIVRFRHGTTEIHAGQTVEWNNLDPVLPHTITFGPDPVGDPSPPSPDVTVDADGARHAVITSTSDTTHSGFIIAAPQERLGLPQSPLGFTRFRVTFPNEGVFPYRCALHDNLGMTGTVIVEGTPTGPHITVNPTSITFTGIAGGAFPAPQSIQITASNGASWHSFDTSPWFNAHPTSGASGASTTLTPHTDGLAAGTYMQNITFSAAGCPSKVVVVTLVLTP